MIDKKFLFFKTRRGFEENYRDIQQESIVFIKGETPADRAIWTHGVFYEPSTGLEHSKGFFESYLALISVYPWPEVGDWAIVATSDATWTLGMQFPATLCASTSDDWVIYTCAQQGLWTKTERTYNKEGIDLTEYLKRDEIDLTLYITRNELNLNLYLTKNEASSVYASQAVVNEKQDKLISGVNLRTVNGLTLLGSGNISVNQVINIESGDSINLDDYATKSLVEDMQDDIESLREILNNISTPDDQDYIYLVFLTLELYDALEEYDEDTLYFIVERTSWVFGGNFPVTLT